MTASSIDLTAEKIVLVRDGVRILDGLSIEAVPGKLTAIIGPNGAGKSSLLAVLSGLWAAEGGTVRLGGRDIHSFSPTERAKRCAVMRQDNPRPAGLTVLESVALGRAATGATAAREKAWSVLEQTGLMAIADRDCARLSGGEWQRVAFARSLVQIAGTEPRGVLLLDEPVSNLDPVHQHHVLVAARRLAGNGHTVLTVLHDLNLTRQYADHVLLVKAGRVEGSGPASETMRPETLSALYECPVARVRDKDTDLDALVTLPSDADPHNGLPKP